MADNKKPHIEINIEQQRLTLLQDDRVVMQAPVSTAKNGPGEQLNSECTPRGLHEVHEKIGADCETGAVFVGRQPTGEIYTPELGEQDPGRDWILTRILWLSGLEEGKNRSGNVDTLQRYIYIHGCPDEEPVGVANSHGCIRMRNHDVIRLFDLVEEGTRVNIC